MFELKADQNIYVLAPGAYPDTESDYTRTTPEQLGDDIAETLYYLDQRQALFIYDGERKPWEERDPYPDFVIYPADYEDQDSIQGAETFFGDERFVYLPA